MLEMLNLTVPKFQQSVHKLVEQFTFNFAVDAYILWNKLPEEGRASPTIGYFCWKLKASPLSFLNCLAVATVLNLDRPWILICCKMELIALP